MTALFCRPAVNLTYFVGGIAVFVLFQVALFIGCQRLVVYCVFLGSRPIVRLRGLLYDGLLRFTVEDEGRDAIQRSIPLDGSDECVSIRYKKGVG